MNNQIFAKIKNMLKNIFPIQFFFHVNINSIIFFCEHEKNRNCCKGAGAKREREGKKFCLCISKKDEKKIVLNKKKSGIEHAL